MSDIFGDLPKGTDLRPMVEQNDTHPEFAKKYPTLHKYSHILASGNFRAWQTETPMKEFEETLLKMETEGRAFHVEAQAHLKDDEATLKANTDEVQRHEQKLSYMKGNPTRFNIKTVEMQEYKTGCLTKHLELMQKEHGIEVKIGDIGMIMLKHQSHLMATMFKIKAQEEQGVPVGPATMFDLMNVLRTIGPADKERAKLREEKHKTNKERLVVEKTVKGIFMPDDED